MTTSDHHGPALCLACVDVTDGTRRLDAIAVNSSGKVVHKSCDSIATLIAWVEEVQPQVIAVDGPSGRNVGLTQDDAIRAKYGWLGLRSRSARDASRNRLPKFWDFRVAEAILSSQGIGLYNTPGNAQKVSDWIKTGWKIYEALEKLGYKRWVSPGQVQLDSNQHWLIEIHPHACFAVGAGYILPEKVSLAGYFTRIAYLQKAASELGWKLTGQAWPGSAWLEQLATTLKGFIDGGACLAPEQALRSLLPVLPVGHDLLDCLVGIITAGRAIAGHAHAVGETRDGVIVLPGALAPGLYTTAVEMIAKVTARVGHQLQVQPGVVG